MSIVYNGKLAFLFSCNKMDKEKNSENCKEKEIIIDLDDSESDSNGENSNQQSGVSENNEIPLDMKLPKALKVIYQPPEMKFMSNFDPESSNREKRKLNRKFNLEGTGKRNSSVYDETGVLRGAGKDFCDCLNEECPGCHFPCPKCRSCKCGNECRVNRKWMYEAVENEGDKSIQKNIVQVH